MTINMVESRTKVKIVSRRLIKPAAPTPPHLKSYKTSSIDQLAPPAYVPFILYYHANGDKMKLMKGASVWRNHFQKS